MAGWRNLGLLVAPTGPSGHMQVISPTSSENPKVVTSVQRPSLCNSLHAVPLTILVVFLVS